MGSTYTIKYVRTQDSPSAELLKRETDAILAEVDQQMSTYRDDSVIEQFNQAPAGSCQSHAGRQCWSWSKRGVCSMSRARVLSI